MQYRRLDENGDMLPYTLLNPPFKDAEAVGAAIRSRLLSFYGEWWEDPDAGIPIDILFGRTNIEQQNIAEALIRERVGEVEHVSQVLSIIFTDDSKTRDRHISITVDTDFGEEVTMEV